MISGVTAKLTVISTFWLNLKNIQVKSIQIKSALKNSLEISWGPGVAEIKNHREPKIGKH